MVGVRVCLKRGGRVRRRAAALSLPLIITASHHSVASEAQQRNPLQSLPLFVLPPHHSAANLFAAEPLSCRRFHRTWFKIMSGGAPIRVMAESFRPISLNECPQWYRGLSDAISNENNHVKIIVINTTVYMTTTFFANYSNYLSSCGRFYNCCIIL